MRGTLVVLAVLSLCGGFASAQKPCDARTGKRGKGAVQKPPPVVPPTINIGPMTLAGKQRNAMLLQFLERADEELERASLERKSFVPALVRSIDDETL